MTVIAAVRTKCPGFSYFSLGLCPLLYLSYIFFSYKCYILFYEGHRRLLEHLTDPACPSIRRFIESLPENTHTSENGFKIVFPSNASQNGVQDSLKHGLAGVEGTCIPVGGEDEGLKGGTETCQGEGTSRERSRRHNEAIALREAYNGCLKALQDFR